MTNSRQGGGGRARIVISPRRCRPGADPGEGPPAERADADRPYERYDDVLTAYADWLLGQRPRAGGDDLHAAMAQASPAGGKPTRRSRSARTHPPRRRRAPVMADALLAGLNAPPTDPDLAAGSRPGRPHVFAARLSKLVRDRGRLLVDAG
jgi:hypothetical protein